MRSVLPRRVPRHPRFRSGRVGLAVRLVALAAVGTMALAACTTSTPPTVTVTQHADGSQVTAPSLSTSPGAPTSSSTGGSATPTSSSATDAIRVTATPAFGSSDVGPNDPISVMAFHAQLKSMTMSGSDGSVVNGQMGDGNNSWSNTDKLKYGVKYTISGEAVGTDGTSQPIDGTITTVKPASTMAAYIQIPNDSTVGIAAPIVVTFAGTVTNRAAAEKELHVTINGGQQIEGSWGWMQDEDIQGKGVKQSRVHFRPKDFWPAKAKVHVEADLYGVNYGTGWGRENLTRDFNIGPKIIVKTDIEKHRLYVIQDDQIIKNYPVSYGKPASVDAGRTTVSGVHVITEKFEVKSMCNPKYGYCGIKEPWAVRINNNGEFIHANPETEKLGLLGKANITHGCVNMSVADAKDFYNLAYYGIPVDVEGTGVKMSYSDYIWDWGVDYNTWKSFSAL